MGGRWRVGALCVVRPLHESTQNRATEAFLSYVLPSEVVEAGASADRGKRALDQHL